MSDWVESRSDIEVGETYFYQHRKESLIAHLDEGDIVEVERSSSQKAPVGEALTVTEDNLEEVTVETDSGVSYILTGIHHVNGEGSRAWLRTSSYESAGEVIELKVRAVNDK